MPSVAKLTAHRPFLAIWVAALALLAFVLLGGCRATATQSTARPEVTQPSVQGRAHLYEWLLLATTVLLCGTSAAYCHERRKHAHERRAEATTLPPERSPALDEALARIAASETQLESFAYATSRELAEPLRNVDAFLDLIDRRLPAEDRELLGEYVASGKAYARKMDRLIGDVLAFSRIHQEVRLSPKRVSLPFLLAQLGAELRAAHPGRVIDLRIDGEGEVLAAIEPLRQAFGQLLENAALYNAHAIIRVGLTVRRINDRVRVEVSDNGIGIAPEHHGRVFALFQRLHTAEAYPGTGLGLAVAQRIVTRLGGELTLVSAPGRGSVFTVHLPIDTTPVVAATGGAQGAMAVN